MAVAYIKGLQSREVIATVKHLAANNQEYNRYNVSSDLDVRTLHEIYLPAFRAAVEEAHVGAVMNSYYDDDKDKHLSYSEGIFTGYRHFDRNNIEPLFPFGYGLSYTSFSYNNILVEPGNEKSQFRVCFNITNAGKMAGAEVAQVYVSKLNPGIERPIKELKGFSKVFLEPSETKRVEVILDRKSFEYYDINVPGWNVEGGDYEILVGSSSRDILLKGLVKDYGR